MLLESQFDTSSSFDNFTKKSNSYLPYFPNKVGRHYLINKAFFFLRQNKAYLFINFTTFQFKVVII